VVDAAELVALPGVDTLDGRGDLQLVDATGDDVHPGDEGRHAEVVDHVGRVEVELDPLVDRQHQRRDLVGVTSGVDVLVVGVVAVGTEPDVTVEVMGQQWTWTFNYGVGEQNPDAVGDFVDGEPDFAYEDYVYTVGDGNEIPTLVLPVDQRIQFNLHSPDVIHNFGVPSFLTRMDVIPGRVNKLQVTPTVEGTYAGKCYELCGVYHSRMLFNVEVVSQEDYEAYLDELEAAGQTAAAPLLGGSNATTQTGLGESQSQEGSQE
jgi:heme/copper-type cytochrome/quinol oxidase subunit 2